MLCSGIAAATFYGLFMWEQFLPDLPVQFIDQLINKCLVELGEPHGVLQAQVGLARLPAGKEACVLVAKPAGHFLSVIAHEAAVFSQAVKVLVLCMGHELIICYEKKFYRRKYLANSAKGI